MVRESGESRPPALLRPHSAVVRERLRDPSYRKHYMRYHIRISIATLVKSLRETAGLTQMELAGKAGIPQPQLARLESLEDERVPGLEQLVKIFAALDAQASLSIVPPGAGHPRSQEIVLL